MALRLITESWWVYSPVVSVISETLSIVGIVTGSLYLRNEPATGEAKFLDHGLYGSTKNRFPSFTVLNWFIRTAKRPLGLLCSQFERAAESLSAQPLLIAPRQPRMWLDRVHVRRTKDLRVGA
jgi:hypothetical protein